MQRSDAERRPRRYRSVWISDVHLGSRAARTRPLLALLGQLECETLYLVGDIVDLWQLERKPYWPSAHNAVVGAILEHTRRGTRVVYLPGNHDASFRTHVGATFGGVEVLRHAEHRCADGRRLLVTHGDEFDAAVKLSAWADSLGSSAYDLLLSADVAVNALRLRCGFEHWSLAAFIKSRLPNAQAYIRRYELAAAAAAAAAGLDGIVCGHIHRPALKQVGEIVYMNCGDWVESLSALAEHRDGRLELLRGEALAGDLQRLAGVAA